MKKQKKARQKRAGIAKGGRPARPMPDLIPDTPENIAKACMQGPPKKQWDYLADPTKS
ncbi:MAG: hypothetical protein OXC18_19140 [Desulfurellaceae bacterium]|nr:hypothetical protein [Desulfurellaceae bacterium]